MKCPRCKSDLLKREELHSCSKCGYSKNRFEYFPIRINNDRYMIYLYNDRTEIANYYSLTTERILNFRINADIAEEKFEKYLVLI
jgi:hypothetical protein